MYTYCWNDPVNFVDPTGYFAATAFDDYVDIAHYNHLDALGGGAGQDIGSWGSSGTSGKLIGQILGGALALGLAVNETSSISITEEKENEINLKHPGNFTVYFLADENKIIRYVGRTKNLEQRLYQHKKPGSRTSIYEFAFAYSNLTYTEARGLEEIGIIFYGTLNSTGNLIKGISENNLNIDIYFESALDVIYNRELNIILNAKEGFQ